MFGFSSKPPRMPDPPPPEPVREDPAVAEAATKLRLSEQRRRGRASTIITGARGVTEDAPLARASATAAPTAVPKQTLG